MSTFRQSQGMPTAADIARAMQMNPKALGQALMKVRAEKRLIDFVRLMWRVIEPGVPLRVGFAMEAICEHLEAVSNGQIRNLLINCPPGFSKSILVDVFWPAWEWGPRNRPDIRLLSWSYSAKLTEISNTKCRDLIRSPLYRALWGDRFFMKSDQDAKLFFKNNAGGFKLASSVGGVGTGLRGDRLILDDPHSVDGADSDADRKKTISWFGGTMSSRVRNANDFPEMVDGMMAEPSATVIIMQRVHRRDISGVIIDECFPFEHLLIEMEYEGKSHPARRSKHWKGSSIGYVDPREKMVDDIDKAFATFRQPSDVERVAAISDATIGADTNARRDVWWADFGAVWTRIARDTATLADPARYARSTLETQKARMRQKAGTNAVASQYRQWPFEGTGTLFRREWFKFCEVNELPAPGRDDCRGWDLAATDAATADATATTKLRMAADGRIYVLHAGAVRKTPAGVEDYIKATATADGKGVIQSFPQDPGSAGKHVIAYLARTVLAGFRFRSSPEMKAKAKRAEPFSSQVEHGVVTIVRGAWNEEYLSELCDFPHGLHDDLVDSSTRAYDAIINIGATSAPVAPKLYVGKAPA